MKRYLKIAIGIFISVLVIVIIMFGVVYAGDRFLTEIGMSVAEAKEIILLFLNACCGSILALSYGGIFFWFLPLIWRAHKKRKKEAREEQREAREEK